MKSFQDIYQLTVQRKGGEQAVLELLPAGIKEAGLLRKIPDHRYLSGISRAIFKAGFVWRVIDQKWPAFEDAFYGFDIQTCLHLSADDENRLLDNERIVRNRQKIVTVPKNAMMLDEIAAAHGSFAKFVADWPSSDFIGLLSYLRVNGARLGGATSQYFLRFMGKDGFILAKDGVTALIHAGIIDRPPNSKRDMNRVQQAFNQWHGETGWKYADISRILSCSMDHTDQLN